MYTCLYNEIFKLLSKTRKIIKAVWKTKLGKGIDHGYGVQINFLKILPFTSCCINIIQV